MIKKLFLLCALLGACLFADTRVAFTVYTATNQLANGTLTFSNPYFTTASGEVVAARRWTEPLAKGVVSVLLKPTEGADPSGVGYTVVYSIVGSKPSTWTETWNVPNLTNAGRSDILTTSSLPIDLSQLSPSGASDGYVPVYNASTGKWRAANSPSSAIVSIFGRTGTVTAQANDYSGVYEWPLTFSAPFDRSTNTISCPTCLTTGTGWPTFNQNTTGTAAGITGKTFAGTATQIPLLSGTPAGSKCVHTDVNGNLTEASADCGSGSGGLSDPGSNGIVKRTALNTTAPATAADIPLEIMAELVGNTVVIGPTCSVTRPCVTQLDDVGTSRTASQTASAPVGTGTVYFYIDSAGTLIAGHNLGVGGLTCTGGMTCTQPVVAFPAGAIHIATATTTLGVFDVAGIVNWFPLAQRDNYTAGAGIIITGHSIAAVPSSTCSKYTTAYNDAALNVGGTAATKTILTLAAQAKITGITIKWSTAFLANGLTKLTVSLGTSTDAIAYTPAIKIHSPVVSGNVTSDGSGTITVTTAAAHNLIVADRAVLSSCATAGLNGDWPIATTPLTTTFTIINSGVNNANSAGCVLTTVSNLPPSFYDDGGHFSQNFASHDVIGTFTSTSANLNTLTAGSVDVWVCQLTLP